MTKLKVLPEKVSTWWALIITTLLLLVLIFVHQILYDSPGPFSLYEEISAMLFFSLYGGCIIFLALLLIYIATHFLMQIIRAGYFLVRRIVVK